MPVHLLNGGMLAMFALHDVGTSFFKPPCLVVSWELCSSCIVTTDIVGARRNLNLLVIIHQYLKKKMKFARYHFCALILLSSLIF